MKHRGLIFVLLAVVLLLLQVSFVSAEINSVTPSTNDINRTNGWAHVDQVSKGIGTTTLRFIGARPFAGCFEYRTDGDTSQKLVGRVNYNPFVTDGMYPFTCVNDGTPSTIDRIIAANQYVEIRMVFGAETDERFDWTRFDVLPPPCRIDAPASVNEGASFTATVLCDNKVQGAFGFQFGTSWAGDAEPGQRAYDAGSFVTDAGANIIPLKNQVAGGLYSVTRLHAAGAANGPFTLGSVGFGAHRGLTANGSATLTLNSLLLGDESGADLHVAFVPTTTVTIIDLYTFRLTVASDGTVQQVRDVTAVVDSVTPDATTPSATPLGMTFVYNDKITPPYTPSLSADMKSHLECASPALSLTASVTDLTINLKAGDVVLDSTDATPSINLFDSTAIGLAYGQASTDEVDVNGDGTVNVFDLIHVGRNYGAVKGLCS